MRRSNLTVIARSESDEAIHVGMDVYILDRHGRLRGLAMTKDSVIARSESDEAIHSDYITFSIRYYYGKTPCHLYHGK